MRKPNVAVPLAALLLLSAAVGPASAEEPFGIGLEGFAYPYPVHMFVIPASGERLNMAYMDVPPAGAANGHTALLLHGRNFPGSYWQATIKALTADGYRVVAPDQIGFGKSSKPLFDLHFDMLARNSADLLDALKIEKVDIVAHSMGGMLATRFARSYPERVERMVLAAPIGLEDYRRYVPPVPNGKLIAQDETVTPASYRQWMMQAYEVALPPTALDPYVEARTRIGGSADYPRWLTAFANSYQMIWREPVADEIPLLTQPVLFVIGENDHVAPGRNFAPEALRAEMGHNVRLAKELAAKMPTARVEVFEGVGHLIHLEAAQRFNEVVLNFLNEDRP
ncbi:MAG: alpha/beta hydrolase [Methyloceanibacter sp.]